MTVERISVFKRTLHKTDEWIRELMHELEWDDPERTYAVLRATLHALRDRITVHEAAQLSAQLPLLIRGVFYEGWHPATQPAKDRHLDQFLDRIGNELPLDPRLDLQAIARAVFKLLARHVDSGEIRDVESQLPKPIRELWPDPLP